MSNKAMAEAEIAQFLSTHYNLKQVTFGSTLETKGDRLAFLVKSDRGRWIVKITESGRTETVVQADVRTPFFLAEQGFPAPRPHETCGGQLYLPYGDRYLYIYPFIEGSHPRPWEGFYRRLGQVLAHLHSITPSPDIPLSGYRPEGILPEVRQGLVAVSHQDQRSIADELLALVERFPSFLDVPEGIQHSDPYFVNLIENQEGDLYLIDWDDSGVAYPLLDVGYVLAHLCTFTPSDRIALSVPGPADGPLWRPDWAAIFLSAYESVRPLNPVERLRLPDAVRLSFLAYIMHWDGSGLVMENYQRMKLVDWDSQLL